jgi:hypothetical protein
MSDILALALSVLPLIVLVAFPLVLVRVLHTAGAPEAVPSDVERSFGAERAHPRSVLAGRPVSARA